MCALGRSGYLPPTQVAKREEYYPWAAAYKRYKRDLSRTHQGWYRLVALQQTQVSRVHLQNCGKTTQKGSPSLDIFLYKEKIERKEMQNAGPRN